MKHPLQQAIERRVYIHADLSTLQAAAASVLRDETRQKRATFSRAK